MTKLIDAALRYSSDNFAARIAAWSLRMNGVRARVRACARLAAPIMALSLVAWHAPALAQSLALQSVASGLVNPVSMANAGDGSKRLFIVEQGGTIRIYNGTQILPTPFLDVSAKVTCCG